MHHMHLQISQEKSSIEFTGLFVHMQPLCVIITFFLKKNLFHTPFFTVFLAALGVRAEVTRWGDPQPRPWRPPTASRSWMGRGPVVRVEYVWGTRGVRGKRGMEGRRQKT